MTRLRPWRLHWLMMLASVLSLTTACLIPVAAQAQEEKNGVLQMTAHELVMPDGKPAEWTPEKLRRLYKVVEDEEATDGKALQVYADTRVLQKGSIPVFKTEMTKPVGLYRVTARIKISGMLNVIGTAIRFDGKVRPPKSLGPNTSPWHRYWEPTLHSYHFKEEEQYQEFSFLTEVIEPDVLTNRPSRPKIKTAGYTRLESKAEHERWRKIWASGGSVADVDHAAALAKREEERKALLAKQKWEQGQLPIEITLLETVNKGLGKSHNSLRQIVVDWVRVEPVPQKHLVVRQVLPQKLWLKPGNEQTFHVWLHNRSGEAREETLRLSVVHGTDTKIVVGEEKIQMANGEYLVHPVKWKVPGSELWGCEVVAEIVADGEVKSRADGVFNVQTNPWAIMNFGGANRNRNPYHQLPHYVSLMEMYGISYRDGTEPFPPNPDEPYISGMSHDGTQTSLDMQRRAVEHNRRMGVASFMYIQPMNGTGELTNQVYEEHPEWFRGPIGWTDQINDNWLRETEGMLKRWHAGQDPVSAAGKGLIHIEAPLNHAVDDVFYNMLEGSIKAVKHVRWDGIRWDGYFGCYSTNYMNTSVGPGSLEADQELSGERSRVFKERMLKEVPTYTESANIGVPSAVYNRKIEAEPPENSKFHAAFLADGSSAMDEGWMHAHHFTDPRARIKDYLWAAHQGVIWCRKLGGYWYGFPPDRDHTPYFSQSMIYFNLLLPLAGGMNYAPHTCTPWSETGEAHFVTRFSEFLFDLKLQNLADAGDLIRVDSPDELWYDEVTTWRDLPDGRRRYVIPLVNPPTIEKFLRDRFSELPEPVTEPFPVEIQMPEGFSDAKVTMLTAEPRTAVVPLEAEADEDMVTFEVPELMMYRVLVVEFSK